MTWWEWLTVSVWLAGVIPAFRRIAWVAAADIAYSRDSLKGDDIAFGVLVATVTAPLWPLIVIARSGYTRRVGQVSLWERLLLTPPRSRRRRMEQERLERRIRELERENERLDRARNGL